MNIWNTYTGERRRDRSVEKRECKKTREEECWAEGGGGGGGGGVQWVAETGRRVRNSLLFLFLSLSYLSPWCKSDCQMDPGELCH